MIKHYQIFKETINNVIQNSNLDIGAAYFILKDIFSEIEKAYYAQLNMEFIEEAKKTETDSNSMEGKKISNNSNCNQINQNKKEWLNGWFHYTINSKIYRRFCKQ